MSEYHQEQYELLLTYVHQDVELFVLKIHKYNGNVINEFGETVPTYIPTNETFTAKEYEVFSFEDQGYLLNN